jgi:hypothetical protein
MTLSWIVIVNGVVQLSGLLLLAVVLVRVTAKWSE